MQGADSRLVRALPPVCRGATHPDCGQKVSLAAVPGTMGTQQFAPRTDCVICKMVAACQDCVQCECRQVSHLFRVPEDGKSCGMIA